MRNLARFLIPVLGLQVTALPAADAGRRISVNGSAHDASFALDDPLPSSDAGLVHVDTSGAGSPNVFWVPGPESQGGDPSHELLGPTAAPELAADLDGDGDEEVLLSQWDGFYLRGLDERGILWTWQVPEAGVGGYDLLIGDFASSPGDEVFFVAQDQEDFVVSLALLDAEGVTWEQPVELDGYSHILGEVNTDADARSELALAVVGVGDMSVHVFDGEAGERIRISKTSFHAPDPLTYAYALISDGPPGAPDEALFVHGLGNQRVGYYAERRSLDTDELRQSAIELSPDFDLLTQGPDYTGDGRRDAFITPINTDDESAFYGLLNAATLEIEWTSPIPDAELWDGPFEPFPVGDIDGDGGEDVCFVLSPGLSPFNEEPVQSATAIARCEAGATGADIWEVRRTISGEPQAVAGVGAPSDLDGDGHADPIVVLRVENCDEKPSCTTLEERISSFSGLDGSTLWPDPASVNLSESKLLQSDLDGIAGDDLFERYLAPFWDLPRQAEFTVRNGRDLVTTWEGAVQTDGHRGVAGGILGADLDGDGSNDAVVTARGYEVLGDDPDCTNGCYLRVHAYVGAIERGGDELWNFEI